MTRYGRKNYVYCVNNRITGITVKICRYKIDAISTTLECPDLEVKDMQIE